MNHNPPLIPRVSPYAVWYYLNFPPKEGVGTPDARCTPRPRVHLVLVARRMG